MTWSSRAEEIVARLIAGLSVEQLDPSRKYSARVRALPLGWSLWGDYDLCARGEVVIVGEDFNHPDVETVRKDKRTLLEALAWASQQYPELREVQPHPIGALDCVRRQIPVFATGTVMCPKCAALGWELPPEKNSDSPLSSGSI